MRRVDNETNEKICEYIRYKLLYREESGIVGFAEKIGVKRTKVQDWLRGKADITLGDLIAISEAYGISIDCIVGLVPENKYSLDEKVRIVSEYTGLSHKAIELLHLHKVKMTGSSATTAINFILENLTFYAQVIPQLFLFLGRVKGLPKDRSDAIMDPYNIYTDLNKEEQNLVNKLFEKQMIFVSAFEFAKFSLTEVTDTFMTMLKKELYLNQDEIGSRFDEAYLSRLQNSPDMEPEETEEDEQ